MVIEEYIRKKRIFLYDNFITIADDDDDIMRTKKRRKLDLKTEFINQLKDFEQITGHNRLPGIIKYFYTGKAGREDENDDLILCFLISIFTNKNNDTYKFFFK